MTEVTFDHGIFDQQPGLENLGCRSKIPLSNVTVVKHHWWSKVPWSNVTCGQDFLISIVDQKSGGQMSLAVKGPAVKRLLRSSFSNLAGPSKILQLNVSAVKCPAVKCHLRSNVPRSNVTCGQMSRGQMSRGQMSRGQMSLAVKCPAVKCQLRSNVPRSNVTVVKCLKILKWSKVRGQMSRGQMRLWSYETQSGEVQDLCCV